jgi:hypothetical protein
MFGTDSGGQTWEERHHPADLSVHGRMILKWNLKEIRLGRGGADWINLAQDRCKCQAVVNTVMNLRVL